jgi:hypothetical protein
VSYICFNLLQGGNIVVNSTSTDILNWIIQTQMHITGMY